MSGWIKIEKDLRDDVRVRRMALALAARYISFDVSEPIDFNPCNACAFPGVTLVLGGLAQLWMHADSFARDDDTLDLRPDEIDELTGIKGFAEILPSDWLEILEEERVKLPGFQQHNGTEAKRKALTAKRISRFRDNQKRESVTPCNADALPDQTKTRPRLEKTIPTQEAAPGFDPALISNLDLKAWGDWVDYRKTRKPAIRPESRQKAAEQMAALGLRQRAAVDYSVANGYQGLVEPKVANGSGQKSRIIRAKSVAELEAEETAHEPH